MSKLKMRLPTGSIYPSHIQHHLKKEVCSVKNNNFQNFANFTGKHLCCSLFLLKLLIENPTQVKFLRSSILKNICERLLKNFCII